MPNHVVTHLFIEGTPEQVEQVKAFVRCDTEKERLMDFNKIIPTPEELNIESGSRGETGMAYLLGNKAALDRYGQNNEEREKAIRLGAKYLVNQALYGATTWYDWHNHHWGTKWNAYETEDLGNGIKFETAWSFPRPVMIALSRHFPDIDFHFVYADEDASYNTGEGYLRNGEFTQQYYPEGGSKDAWTLYLLTHEWASDELELQEDGTYRWKED